MTESPKWIETFLRKSKSEENLKQFLRENSMPEGILKYFKLSEVEMSSSIKFEKIYIFNGFHEEAIEVSA